MNLICKITDNDLGLEYNGIENPSLRLGARGIVIRDDGKIAIFNKSNKNEYKLPGGGIEGNEEPKEAFKREVLEETGCVVEILEELGTTEEYKLQNNLKQISYIYVGKVLISKKNNIYEKILNIKKCKNYLKIENNDITFIKPILSCKINYLERTKNGHLRHPKLISNE